MKNNKDMMVFVRLLNDLKKASEPYLEQYDKNIIAYTAVMFAAGLACVCDSNNRNADLLAKFVDLYNRGMPIKAKLDEATAAKRHD